jgi:predicted DNA-binding transcriptional regulator AlpA
MKEQLQPRMMRMKDLVKYTSFSRAYMYQQINEGSFHPGHMISPGIRAWEKSEVDAWLDRRMGKLR